MAKRKADAGRPGLVVFAKNKNRVSAFYRSTLGLVSATESPTHDVLRGRNGVEIIIHAIPKKYASSIRIGRPPEVRESAAFKPTFVVASLEAVRVAAKTTGGALKPLDAAWRFDGTLVLDGTDPEGNVVQFKQPTE